MTSFSYGQPCLPSLDQTLQQQQQQLHVLADSLQLTDWFLEKIVALDGILPAGVLMGMKNVYLAKASWNSSQHLQDIGKPMLGV